MYFIYFTSDLYYPSKYRHIICGETLIATAKEIIEETSNLWCGYKNLNDYLKDQFETTSEDDSELDFDSYYKLEKEIENAQVTLDTVKKYHLNIHGTNVDCYYMNDYVSLCEYQNEGVYEKGDSFYLDPNATNICEAIAVVNDEMVSCY